MAPARLWRTGSLAAIVMLAQSISPSAQADDEVREFYIKTVHIDGQTIMRHLLRSAGYCLSALLLIAVAMTGDAFAAPPSKADPVRSWNLLALQTVRARSLSDAQAARLYAMVNVAMYDAVNAIIVARHGADGRTSALVRMGGAPRNANPDVAAAAAAHAVLSGEFPDLRPEYDYQLNADLVDAGAAGPTEAGQQWGYRVGAAVRAARANDGSTPTETQPGGFGPGQFRAAWSGVQFRNLTPFGIANSTIYRGAGPAALDGLDYASAFAEVKLLGSAALTDPAKLATFQFWSLGAGTAQPPGAWIQVALAVTKKNPPPLAEKARLLALVSMALSDTVAPTVWSKSTFNFWRPATAIREADSDGNALTDPDPSWSPRAGGIGGKSRVLVGSQHLQRRRRCRTGRLFLQRCGAIQPDHRTRRRVASLGPIRAFPQPRPRPGNRGSSAGSTSDSATRKASPKVRRSQKRFSRRGCSGVKKGRGHDDDDDDQATSVVARHTSVPARSEAGQR